MHAAASPARAISTYPVTQPGATLVAVASVFAGVVVFGFRLLSVRDLSNDHYLYLALAQQLLAGSLPGRDFVDAGMPLAYSLSALAQLAQPGPFSEAALTAAMLGVAAAVTCLVVTRMTGSLLAGVGAALLEAALFPRFYSFPKILVPVVALALLQWYVTTPSWRRLAMLALWTVLGALLRYDMGVYAGVAITAGLVTAHWRDWGRAARAVGAYVGAGVAAGLPYAAYVMWAEGLAEHMHGTVEFTKNETHGLAYDWPGFPAVEAGSISEWGAGDSAAFLFYVVRALAVVPLVLLIARRRLLDRRAAAIVVAAIAFAWLYLVLILRHPIEQRIQDLAAILAVVGAWTAVETGRLARPWLASRALGLKVAGAALAAVIVVVTAASAASAGQLNNLREHLRETGIARGPAAMRAHLASIVEDGTVRPWAPFWPTDEVPAAIEYLRACTLDTDRLVLTWSAPEYYYFSGRPFAAGHALVLPPRAFTNPGDQRRMIEFMQVGRVPVALVNESRQEQFEQTYPLFDAYLKEHYEPVARFSIYDGSEIAVSLHRDLTPTGTWGEQAWPCGL